VHDELQRCRAYGAAEARGDKDFFALDRKLNAVTFCGRIMNRTNLHKIIYFSVVALGALIILWLFYRFKLNPFETVLLVIVLLIPGRILGFFWKDLLRGLRLLNAKKYSESKIYSERFLETLSKKPWLKHLIWFGSSTYSRNPKALALNNLGAAEFGLNDFTSARLHFEESITVDGQNPLPYFNMGLLTKAQGDLSEAKSWFEKAANRGFSKNIIDQIISTSQARFAFTDGQ
jgi:tetratricopeptide (TPR) repeat protein